MVKYETIIKKVGEMVEEGLEENLIILFNDDAPEMYHEYCLLHTINELTEEVKTGDIFCIDSEEYKITAVGSGANKTLGELGHATIKFDGSLEAENPGTIHVEAKTILIGGENSILKFKKS